MGQYIIKIPQIHWLIIWLVVYLSLWKIWKSVGNISRNIWKNITCSKPPTNIYIYVLYDKRMVLPFVDICWFSGESWGFIVLIWKWTIWTNETKNTTCWRKNDGSEKRRTLCQMLIKKDNYYRQQKSGWHARWAPQRDVCKALLNIIVVSLLWAQQLLELVAPNGYRKPGPHFAGIYWDTSI